MSSAPQRQRRLWLYGMVLFVLGLLTGAVIPSTTNQRMGLSAHLAGVLNAIVLLLFGVLWPHLRLSGRLEAIARWSALTGTYGLWFGLLIVAKLGTNRATPIAGAGFGGRRPKRFSRPH